jgi:hypothetical protein
VRPVPSMSRLPAVIAPRTSVASVAGPDAMPACNRSKPSMRTSIFISRLYPFASPNGFKGNPILECPSVKNVAVGVAEVICTGSHIRARE